VAWSANNVVLYAPTIAIALEGQREWRHTRDVTKPDLSKHSTHRWPTFPPDGAFPFPRHHPPE
jgi:hypothetical protein